MRLAVVAGVILMAALSPLQAAATGRGDRLDRNAYFQKIIGNPAGGDEVLVNRVLRNDAQQTSDKLFSQLAKVLGGDAPRLNFVPSVGSAEFHMSATPTKNAINVDPAALQWLIDAQSTFHDSAVNGLPHEFAHTRQTPSVLASVPQREGGAQAFADLVTNVAASKAGIPYGIGNYDGSYSDFVKAAQARGPAWILGGQFGRPPVDWP